MGRMAGFKYREVARRLRMFGYVFDRQAAGSHEVWRNEKTGQKVTLPHHSKDMAEGTLGAVLCEASIDIEAFLRA
jgi:predicted RNA binding protein YcfA (HicA-like mRNA interferase family)